MCFFKARKKFMIPVLSVFMSLSAVCMGGNPMQVYAETQAQGIHVASHTQQEIREYAAANGAKLNDALTFKTNPVTTAPYAAGELSDATQQAALNMLNQIRYIAGISDNVTLDKQYGELTQAAALVNYVNDELSHYPDKPSDMDELLFKKGEEGAGSSNIAMASWKNRSLNETIVMSWMEDGDNFNIDRLGHRRWLINPQMGKTGFGAVTGENGTYSSVYAFDRSNSSANEYGVAWPAQNMPVEYFSTEFPWSISLGKEVDKNSVTVTLTKVSNERAEKTWEFSAEKADGYFNVDNGGYGQTGCIIFRPNKEAIGSYQAGDEYQVTIDITGESSPISYSVNFFALQTSTDPDPAPGTEKELVSITAEYNGGPLAVGSTVNKADILVKAKYSDNSENTVTDFEIVPDPSIIQAGTNTLTIRYQGKTAEVTITGISAADEKITLRFDTRGGTPVGPVTLDKNASINPLPATTREGYVFDGWYTAIDGGTKITEDTTFSESATLHAHWTENTITELKAEYLGKYLMAGTKEWIDKNDLRVTAVYLNGATEEVTTYSIDDYTIAEGDNVLTVRYEGKAAEVTVLGVSVKNIGVIYQGGAKPEGTDRLEDIDIVVIAELTNGDTMYKVSSYTIDPFVIRLGTNMLTVRLGNKSVSFNVPGGQNTGSASSSVNRITAQYNGGVIRSGSFVNKSDITVTAYFTDGSSRAVTDFTIDNYRIINGNNTLTVRYGGQTASVTVIGDDTNGKVTYQVFFDSQGGTAVEPMVVQADDIILTVPSTSKPGSVFQGWYTMINGGGTRLTPVTRITNNSFYYAYWSDKTITGITAYFNGQAYAGTDVGTGLVVNANYADGTSERIENYTVSKRVLTEGSNPITITHGQYTTNIDIVAVQQGNTPGNTNGSSNDTTNGNTPGDSSSGNQNQTPSQYVINFHANGGTNLSYNKVTVEAGDMIDGLPEVERKNYTFLGWYTSYSGGKKVSSTMIPDASATLYARWSKVKKPAKSAVQTLQSKKSGQLTIKCKKVSGADGYQIGYSTKKDFSSSVKKVTGTATNRTIKSLKKGKKYYVRVRAYKIDSAGNKIYGAYSAKKSITIKK